MDWKHFHEHRIQLSRGVETAHDTVGTRDTRLIVARGNSASAKSSVPAGLHENFGRNLAIVG